MSIKIGEDRGMYSTMAVGYARQEMHMHLRYHVPANFHMKGFARDAIRHGVIPPTRAISRIAIFSAHFEGVSKLHELIEVLAARYRNF